ncbi:hypothetical protein BD324DRAFT_629508 [Kockovaella imperatae]|uniref:RanBD1 domain-containing protein n=1 Tax=Kockovaella imperatae TaxID=4999 RepID=A0A1Y1UEI0_9TREE|nr:hypothetical protein BD324DRAFT_629508 [Kockovaella imperatae]ORX35906.1 hypothetical protein BD324DRAFT_629508 [Kockovaella imperatae]
MAVDSSPESSEIRTKQHHRIESEAHSLKRGRAESVEPPVLDRPETTSTGTKKNRLALSTGQAPSKPLDPDPSPNIDLDESDELEVADDAGAKDEAKNVGEVRRKVEKMTYEEGSKDASEAAAIIQEEDQELELPEKDEDEGPGSAMSTSTRFSKLDEKEGEGENGKAEPIDEEWQEIEKAEAEGAEAEAEALADGDVPTSMPMNKTSSSSGQEGLKRKVADRSESSYNINDTHAQVKRHKDTPSPSEEPPKVLPPVSEPLKKQSTFSSFASTSSPFASARTISPFGASSSASSSTPQPKPSAFKSSGFGNYSNASPFSKPPIKSTTTTEDKTASGDQSFENEPKASTFDDILKADAGTVTEEEKIRMSEQDVHTGEEDESPVHSVRAKLYVMQADGGWRERGVGTLKLNVRRSDGKGARLVMRAEGVLRLILNVSLYVGMSCLEDGKHVRTTVIEDGERKFLTFRTGSIKAASDLSSAIHDHIPLESGASASKSPELESKGRDAAKAV